MKEAYYFSHDANARRDPKILAMRNEYGCEGYGWYWILIEMLSEQEGYKLKHTKWVTNAIAMELLCDTISAEKFVNSCVSDYELLQSDGEYFWSDSLIRRMTIKEEKRLKKVEAGKKGAQKRWKNGESEAPPKQNDSTAIAEDGKGKESKVNKSKEKESKNNYAEFVSLLPTEYEKLVSEHGEVATKKMIEVLDNYKGANGKKYKSDYRAILNWVKDKVLNGKGVANGTNQRSSHSAEEYGIPF